MFKFLNMSKMNGYYSLVYVGKGNGLEDSVHAYL